MMIQVGDVVAFCYCGTHGARRIRNVTVTKVMKTFIEIADGCRFSPVDGRQIRDSNGAPTLSAGMHRFYLDSQVSYWDSKDRRDEALRVLNSGFENLISAARNRNWEDVKSCYAALVNLIDES